MTGIWAVCVAIARPYAPQIPGRARHDARVSGTADLQFRTIAVLPGRSRHDGKALLMRLGLAALRGSNPQSSAVTSSFARALRLGGLLVSAFRGLCVAIAAIRPPIYLIRYPRGRDQQRAQMTPLRASRAARSASRGRTADRS